MSNIVNFYEYSNDFYWDFKLHFPIPTLNYILNRTGEDLLAKFETETEANAVVIKVVRTAKNYLFNSRTDMLKWEYAIARDIDMIYEILEYLLAFIDFSIIMGRYDDLFISIEKGKIFNVLEMAKDNLKANRSATFYVPNDKIRVGY